MKSMRKLFIFTALFFILNIILSMNVSAQQHYNVHNPFPRSERRDNIDLFGEIFDISGAGEIRENLPGGAREILDGEEQDLSVENISGLFNFGFIFNIIMRLAGGLASAAVSNSMPIIALIIISAVVSVTKDLNKSENFVEILNFVMLICLAGAVFYSVRECFYAAKNFLDDIHTYMLTMIPVMASLSTLSGNIASAAANSAGLFAVLNVVAAISNGVILPVLQICYALSLAKCLTESSGAVNLSGINSYVRSVLNWIFIFVMTVLITIMFFQNILAASADSVAARTVKFTITSFVPVVGSIIGDATSTILGSMQAVKSVTGVFGVLVIIITLLPPLISVIMHKLLLKIAGAFALILGLDKQAGFLNEMNSLLDMTLAVMIATSVVFIFNITIFIRTMAVV